MATCKKCFKQTNVYRDTEEGLICIECAKKLETEYEDLGGPIYEGEDV